MNNEYSDALEAVLRDYCNAPVVRDVEAGGNALSLWQALQDGGFADCMLPDVGLTLTDAMPMIAVMGQYALPVPLGQTMFARAVLQTAGMAIPEELIALAVFDGPSRLRAHVPDGATATWYLIQEGGRAALVHRDAADIAPTGVHGDLTVTIGRAPAETFALPAGTLRTFGAALHTALMAGAMTRVFELTLQYANDRSQFGRNIGKFQAIQHQIAVLAEHVAATRMAAQLACLSDTWQPHAMRAAIGKCQASESVTMATAIAHAVHGAIGITEEYDLQLYSRRLHAWRTAHGSERYWGRVIGTAACEADMPAVDQIRRWMAEVA